MVNLSYYFLKQLIFNSTVKQKINKQQQNISKLHEMSKFLNNHQTKKQLYKIKIISRIWIEEINMEVNISKYQPRAERKEKNRPEINE